MTNYMPLAQHRGGHHHSHSDQSLPHAHGGGAPPEYAPPLLKLRRGGLTESVHRGAVAVCEASGKRVKGLGYPAMSTFLRSAAKPLQAIPIITSGAYDRFGLDQHELACMCGSLNGEDFQVATVFSILEKAGLGPELLSCGVHASSHYPTAAAMRQAGDKPQPVHNNCAGKHSAMLVLCVHMGWPTAGYTQPSHPVQALILQAVAEMCAYPAEQISIGIDGCGVPVFRLPLIALAGAFARLAAPAEAGLPAPLAAAASQLMAACLAHPEMIAGSDRLCTRLMQAVPGRLLAKTGTEGTYALAIPELKLGVAFQVEDGATRALAPVACNVLHELDVLDHDTLAGPLADLARPLIKNHRGEVVAELVPVFGL